MGSGAACPDCARPGRASDSDVAELCDQIHERLLIDDAVYGPRPHRAARVARATLELELSRARAGLPIHPTAVVQGAFWMLCPVSDR